MILSRFAKMKLVSWHSAVLHILHIARGIKLIKETGVKEEKVSKLLILSFCFTFYLPHNASRLTGSIFSASFLFWRWCSVVFVTATLINISQTVWHQLCGSGVHMGLAGPEYSGNWRVRVLTCYCWDLASSNSLQPTAALCWDFVGFTSEAMDCTSPQIFYLK